MADVTLSFSTAAPTLQFSGNSVTLTPTQTSVTLKTYDGLPAVATNNFVLAGPGSAPAAAPAFRALVDADIPASIARTSVAFTSYSVIPTNIKVWQVGTVGEVDTTHLIKIATESAPGYYIGATNDIMWNGVPDRQFFIGWNRVNISGQQEDAAYSSLAWVIEQYQTAPGAGNYYDECYFEWFSPNKTYTQRMFHCTFQTTTGQSQSYTTGQFQIYNWQIGTPVITLGNTGDITAANAYFTGVIDTPQLTARAFSTQTTPIFQVLGSGGGQLFSVANNGGLVNNIAADGTSNFQWIANFTGSAQDNIRGLSFALYRDNGGPAWSWTYGINAMVAIRAISANAQSRYAYAGHFEIDIEAANGLFSGVAVTTNVLEVFLTKSGAGTLTAAAMHGVHIGNMGGTGSYAPAAIYIEAQTTPTSGANYALDSQGGRIRLLGLPTSAAGLAAGELWNNSGVINIA